MTTDSDNRVPEEIKLDIKKREVEIEKLKIEVKSKKIELRRKEDDAVRSEIETTRLVEDEEKRTMCIDLTGLGTRPV